MKILNKFYILLLLIVGSAVLVATTTYAFNEDEDWSPNLSYPPTNTHLAIFLSVEWNWFNLHDEVDSLDFITGTFLIYDEDESYESPLILDLPFSKNQWVISDDNNFIRFYSDHAHGLIFESDNNTFKFQTGRNEYVDLDVLNRRLVTSAGDFFDVGTNTEFRLHFAGEIVRPPVSSVGSLTTSRGTRNLFWGDAPLTLFTHSAYPEIEASFNQPNPMMPHLPWDSFIIPTFEVTASNSRLVRTDFISRSGQNLLSWEGSFSLNVLSFPDDEGNEIRQLWFNGDLGDSSIFQLDFNFHNNLASIVVTTTFNEEEFRPVINGHNTIINNINRPLTLGQILSNVRATDPIDGDITHLIRVTQNYWLGNEQVLGNFVIRMSVTNSVGLTATFNLTVANQDHNPTFIDYADARIQINFRTQINESILLLGLSATSHIGVNITSNIRVISNNIRQGFIGVYQVVYEVSDAVGNSSRHAREFEIVHTDVPMFWVDYNTIFISQNDSLSINQIIALVMSFEEIEVIDSTVLINHYYGNQSIIGRHLVTFEVTTADEENITFSRLISVFDPTELNVNQIGWFRLTQIRIEVFFNNLGANISNHFYQYWGWYAFGGSLIFLIGIGAFIGYKKAQRNGY